MRKVLEMFVLRVRQSLSLNDCSDMFWIGNLKHRNIEGEEISSQIPLNETECTEDEIASVEEVGNVTSILFEDNSEEECSSKRSLEE